MDSEHVGKLVRILIDFHRRNKALERIEVRRMVLVDATQLNNLLYQTQNYLHMLGLELVGITDNHVTPIDEAKRLFLRKGSIEQTKREPVTLTGEDKVMFIVFSAIQLENNRLDEKRIPELQKCKSLANMDLPVFLNGMKQAGYLAVVKENEVNYWIMGWRFYVEYDESFDIFEYFTETKG